LVVELIAVMDLLLPLHQKVTSPGLDLAMPELTTTMMDTTTTGTEHQNLSMLFAFLVITETALPKNTK
jgi:hypothetical protein